MAAPSSKEKASSTGIEPTRDNAGAVDEAPLEKDETINKDFQAGVQAVEATTLVWSKRHLVAAYVLCVPPALRSVSFG
jgi:hypothetical protein